ncbi:MULTISPECIES: hypothetical protein [unclassified Haladaptatus]|nr:MULTISPECIES: hypothetical protein [unclassified Haladaptatus]
MLDRVKTVFAVDDDPVVYECRECGTTVESAFSECPYCGEADIARLEIE